MTGPTIGPTPINSKTNSTPDMPLPARLDLYSAAGIDVGRAGFEKDSSGRWVWSVTGTIYDVADDLLTDIDIEAANLALDALGAEKVGEARPSLVVWRIGEGRYAIVEFCDLDVVDTASDDEYPTARSAIGAAMRQIGAPNA